MGLFEDLEFFDGGGRSGFVFFWCFILFKNDLDFCFGG